MGEVGLWKHIRRAGIALSDLLDMMLEMELKFGSGMIFW